MSITCLPRKPLARKQRGVALITVLLIVAICALLATQLISEQQIQFRRTLNQLQGDRAFHYVMSVEEWGRELLIRDAEANDRDDFGDDWATLLPPLEVDGGMMLLVAEDMHGRFNINNLVVNGVPDSKQIKIFQRLLENLELDPDLVWPLVDWLDKNDEPSIPNGAEADEYSELTPPYRPANQAMSSPDELAAMSGFTPEILSILVGQVVALPVLDDVQKVTLININFVTEPLLRALSEKMQGADTEQLIEQAIEDGFSSVNDFLMVLTDNNQSITGLSDSIDRTLLSVQSEYFLLNYQGSFKPVLLKNHSVLYRGSDDKVRIVNRAQGDYYSVATAIY
ncbi:MAG: type II secretion system minor pseudopilin GspK [Pseudomonadales bacterium]|nr:type II secretion system minor pseudopilin GspK [Pseudomonadales bacterium]